MKRFIDYRPIVLPRAGTPVNASAPGNVNYAKRVQLISVYSCDTSCINSNRHRDISSGLFTESFY